mgnify:CR=1 FL=1
MCIYDLHGFYDPEKLEEISQQRRSASIGCVDCKKMLAQAVNTSLAPFRERRAEIASREGYIQELVAEGAKRASIIARETILEVKEKMCLLWVPPVIYLNHGAVKMRYR